jgi:hypothetical protein
MDSLTGISPVSSSSTRHSCRMTNARNLAASCGGGLSKSISRHSTSIGDNCFTTRTIFPCSVYTSGTLKKDSVGAMMRERMRIKWLEVARCAAEPAPVATSGMAADAVMTGATVTVMGNHSDG